MNRISRSVIGNVLVLLFLVGATGPAQAAGAAFDKANFHHPLEITNPYNPLVPGITFVYKGKTDGEPSLEKFVVTGQTKTILEVDTRVIHDKDWENGKLAEDTYDWFAQDDAGNVWYFGEDSTQYQNGKVIGHEGSWEAGVNGALPGIVMEANPQVGDTFLQENAAKIAKDKSTVLSLNEAVCVPYGCFSHVLETKDFSPLEPGVVEHKYFASGVGQIQSIMVQGGKEVSNLVSIGTK